ncbi:RHS repeat-associated core domain-containing protein [Corallococcus soli]
MSSRRRLGLAVGLVLGWWSLPAVAQLAPTGGHYAGRASDTGTSPGAVNASGGYSASIPLEQPASRGGLPVPVAIGSGTRGVGAVGLGWDIPLSYIRRDTTFANRTPKLGTSLPTGREQVTLFLQGQVMDLVPRQVSAGPPADVQWVPRHDAADVLLKESAGLWTMYDGDGRAWTFTQPPSLSGTGLWLLTSITGADNTAVQLDYDVSVLSAPGVLQGLTLDLKQVRYNKHPSASCFKHEVTLNYGALAPAPLALSLMGERVFTRLRTLSTLDVSSRATCAGSPEKLRTYGFTYQADADTRQPRLASVAVFGRQGTPEQSIALPIASYAHGSATTGGRLTYAKSTSIPMPAGVDTTKLSSTGRDGTFTPPNSEVGSATWQSLTDVTGDGLPDLVYNKSGKLWVALNKPNALGAPTLGTVNAQLHDATFASGPFESRGATSMRFPDQVTATGKDRVWRQALDVNGDGRMDFIDAAEVPGQWVLYINTPGTGATGVTWARRSYSVIAVRDLLTSLGHSLPGGYLPLSSRFSGRDHTMRKCWVWNSQTLVWSPHTGSSCGPVPLGTVTSAEAEQTYTEWEVTDVNGDGFPDFVFNSSPVESRSPSPEYAGSFGGQVVYGDFATWVRPRADTANQVRAVFNVHGLLVDTGTPTFSTQVVLREGSCGVGLRTTGASMQRVLCGLMDVNGDGLIDRVEGATVHLGTGTGFALATLTLPSPGFVSVQENSQQQACTWPNPKPPASTPFPSSMTHGLRDLTGDGIPDYVSRIEGSSPAQWTVAVGTGTGFAPAVPIDVTGGAFTLSSQTERCDGQTSLTTGGLYDINGDGRPEVVRINGTALDVHELSSGVRPGKPEAGRLVQVGNGHGATTTIRYRSAKEDGTTKHQVPFPEIVVSAVQTSGGMGLGGDTAETRYAYGGAELVYDPASHAWGLPAYHRSVSMTTVSLNGKHEGYATVTDTYPLPAFDSSSKAARFARYRQVGKVRDVTTVTSVSLDPWTLLANDLSTNTRRLKASHVEWATRLFEEPTPTGTTQGSLDCMELAFPLDFLASWGQVSGSSTWYDTCAARGFSYARVNEAWRGTAAPPSTTHVATRTGVTDVDDHGRILNVKHSNDVYRSDDDICLETKYATPVGGTGPVKRVLLAPSSRRYWTCDKSPFTTYASESWRYDGLAQGSVSTGHLTSHLSDRRDGTGALLDTVPEYVASYDAAGNPQTIDRSREDGAWRTVELAHDEFGLALTEQSIDPSGLPSLITRYELDPVTLQGLVMTDANNTRYGITVDGYGRTVSATLQPPDGMLGVMSTTAYLGLTGGDPLGRRVVSKLFPNPVKPGAEQDTAGTVQTAFLDELGRLRRTESPLGSDYGTEVMISAERTYDSLGRVAFEADPYPVSQNAATAYGTTYHFNPDGTVLCSIRGNGPQAYTLTPNPGAERFPTCYSRAYVNNTEQVGLRDSASLTSTSPQANVLRTATLTGAGRLLSRTTTKAGAPLEHSTFTHDRLGQMTGMTRYQDPVGLTGPVSWSWTFDSFGQRLTWQEPGSALRTMTYSRWGEPLGVTWNEAVVAPFGARGMVRQYDSLGRLKHSEDRTLGVAIPDTAYDFFYDTGASPSPLVTPTNMLGRLSRMTSSVGDVAFSYDAYGRANARVYRDPQGTSYVERMELHGDGALDAITFQLPDNDYTEETVWYAYDTARRLMYAESRDAKGSRELYVARAFDPFGRVLNAVHGGVVESVGEYAMTGRRLPIRSVLGSSHGSREILHTSYDIMGRDAIRTEVVNGGAASAQTHFTYDALGRLAASRRYEGATLRSDWSYGYDALGNVLTQTDALSTADAAMSYSTVDRDRLCRIGHGNGGLGGTACNVTHDSVGNILQQPTRKGDPRQFGYFPSGGVRTITAAEGTASYRYGPLNVVRELNLNVAGKSARYTLKLGDFLELKQQVINGTSTRVLTRHIPGAGGILALRRGNGEDAWVFPFGGSRGTRYTADIQGRFIQDVDYAPFGEAKSSGVGPGSLYYTSDQWNGGDSLESFNLAHLGARLYDPVIGRFLSRDPLFVARTASTTHPYAFAMNDPVNRSDPSGLDPGCIGQECQGGGGFPGMPGGGGGPSGINDPSLYLPSAGGSMGGANPAAASRPIASTAAFTQAPSGAQTHPGRTLKVMAEALSGIQMDPSFSYDSLAAHGFTVGETLDMMMNTQRGMAIHNARANAGIDTVSSFTAGVGDAFAWMIPTKTLRSALGITSGDANPKVRLFGEIVGTIVNLGVMKFVQSVAVAANAERVLNAERLAYRGYLEKTVAPGVINPSGCKVNCLKVAVATDMTLAGVPTTAAAGMGDLALLEIQFGSNYIAVQSGGELAAAMSTWKNGSQAIIIGETSTMVDSGITLSHSFNAVKQYGRVYFVDAQAGMLADFSTYRGGFRILQTR